jgi:hypothetical protein
MSPERSELVTGVFTGRSITTDETSYPLILGGYDLPHDIMSRELLKLVLQEKVLGRRVIVDKIAGKSTVNVWMGKIGRSELVNDLLARVAASADDILSRAAKIAATQIELDCLCAKEFSNEHDNPAHRGARHPG